jgi:hypothetical protein
MANKIGAVRHLECSALALKWHTDVFEEAVRAACVLSCCCSFHLADGGQGSLSYPAL